MSALVVVGSVDVVLQAGNNPVGVLQVRADNPFVQSTSYAGWVVSNPPNAQAYVSLEQCQAWAAFMPKSSFEPLGPGQAQWPSVLQLALTGQAWSRILSELADSGLGDQLDGSSSIAALHAALSSLAINSPDNLLVGAADILPATDSFDVPAIPGRPGVAGAAAVRGQGRGRGRPARVAVAAVAPVPMVRGPPEMRYLSITSAADLQVDGAPLPLAALCRLMGWLGRCFCRGERSRETSPAKAVAGMIRSGISRMYGVDRNDDGALSLNLLDFLTSIELPAALRSTTLELPTMRAEARDSCAYAEAGPEGKARLQAARFSIAAQG
jgi:hypothetical protein